MAEKKWQVVGGGLVLASGMRMRAGCHHTSTDTSSCGGCYARLARAIEEIAADPIDARGICLDVMSAMSSEDE